MNARELDVLVANLSARSLSDLTVRGRALAKNRMRPIGGRGPHAPAISADDAATSLIAAAGARNAVDAVDAVHRFAPLSPVGGRSESFIYAETFGEALQAVVAKKELAHEVKEVRLYLPVVDPDVGNWLKKSAMAKIEWTLGRSEFYSDLAASTADMDKFGGATMQDVVIIGGGLLQKIAYELAKKSGDGARWAGPGGEAAMAAEIAAAKAASEVG